MAAENHENCRERRQAIPHAGDSTSRAAGKGLMDVFGPTGAAARLGGTCSRTGQPVTASWSRHRSVESSRRQNRRRTTL